MSVLNRQQLNLIHYCMLEIAKLNNVPIVSNEALEWIHFENATLDDLVFHYSIAISLDHPALDKEQNNSIALQCVADLLATLVDEYKNPEVFRENPINPSAFFRNWVRIGQDNTKFRASNESSISTGRSDDRQRFTILDISTRKH